MRADVWISLFGLAATLLLVLVGLMNFTVFRKQLVVAREQIDTAMRQLEVAQKQPDLHLIQRAISETSVHVRLLVERPYLRPYFYDGVRWQEGDQATPDEVKAMGELMLNNFASALMHSAAFPEYPVRGIDRIIMFHLRNGPMLSDLLLEIFDRFPFTGLSLLCFKNEAPAGVEADLKQLIEAPGLDASEAGRRAELLTIYQNSVGKSPIDFAVITMQQRR
ncbi:MAG: hypothetical protein ABIV28_04225 [Longimicrobiales bacterium]